MSGVRIEGLVVHRPGRDGGFHLRVPRWTVAEGARVALRGPSGSGKTTLLSAISGELPVAGGSLQVHDVPLHARNGAARAAHRLAHIGMVLPGAALIPWLSVRDNVLLPYRLGPALPRDPGAAARAEALLDELGLSGHARTKPGRLSSGEQQRVAVARALVTEPRLLLADEPTSALDPAAAAAVLAAIDRLCARRGATAIVVTHDATLAAALPVQADMLALRGEPE